MPAVAFTSVGWLGSKHPVQVERDGHSYTQDEMISNSIKNNYYEYDNYLLIKIRKLIDWWKAL